MYPPFHITYHDFYKNQKISDATSEVMFSVEEKENEEEEDRTEN